MMDFTFDAQGEHSSDEWTSYQPMEVDVEFMWAKIDGKSWKVLAKTNKGILQTFHFPPGGKEAWQKMKKETKGKTCVFMVARRLKDGTKWIRFA